MNDRKSASDTRSAAARRFTDRAINAGIVVDVMTFPQGTRTAADAAAAIGCDVAQIVKSLVFIADGEAIVVLVPGDRLVDEHHVRATLNVASLTKASADAAKAATGYAIGGTPPFGHDRKLSVLADSGLLDHDRVWAAAGGPAEVFSIDPHRLLEAADATIVQVTP